jgi:hypothetical protein
VRLSPDDVSPGEGAPQNSVGDAAQQQGRAVQRSENASIAAPAAADTAGVPSASDAGKVRETRVRLEVRAASDVRVGDVFPARIDIEAEDTLRELVFSVSYDKSRLALVAWSAAGFTRQSGLSSELAVDEPSDGNIQVNFKADNQTSAAGAGSLIEFQFEAIKAGTSGIALENPAASDWSGGMDPKLFDLHGGSVAIR